MGKSCTFAVAREAEIPTAAAAGTTLHQADCLIAAAAVGISASLATANVQDFPMSEVRVEAW